MSNEPMPEPIIDPLNGEYEFNNNEGLSHIPENQECFEGGSKIETESKRSLSQTNKRASIEV